MATTLGPNQTNISPGVPFFAPAGSGGGGSGTGTFSTINIVGGVNANVLYSQNISTPSVVNFALQSISGNNSPLFSTLIYQPNILAPVALDNAGSGYTKLGAGAFVVAGLNAGVSPAAGSYLPVISAQAINSGSNLELDIDGGGVSSIISLQSLTSISSLNVSSINGAAPGGGALSPDITVSTLTFPIGNQTTQGIIRYNRLLTLDNTQTGNASDFILFNTITPDQARTPLSTTTLLVNSSSGGSASISIGAGEDGNNYIVSGLSGATVSTGLAPLNIYASTLITSSITVSSINGITPLTGPETSTLQGQVAEIRSTLGFV